MSYSWYEQRRDRQRTFDPWERPNNFKKEFPQFKDCNDSKHFSRFNQDRSRSRLPSFTANSNGSDNKFNTFYNRFRNRGTRRSLSAPRSIPGDKIGWNVNYGQNQTDHRSSKFNASLNHDHNSASRNISNEVQMPQQKKFKSIFGLGKTSNSGIIDTVKPSMVSNVVKVDNIGPISTNVEFKESSPVNSGINSRAFRWEEDLNGANRFNYSKELEVKNIVKFYGESLTELNQQPVEVFKTELPVVDWSKDSTSIDNLSAYDSSKTVGGDGITLEVFYLCKYCKMFTGGCQLNAHLKSKYHYERYKEYLRTGEIAPESGSNLSHSSSESEMDLPKSPLKREQIHKSAMDIDDPTEIVYNCHQELDFD